MADERMLTKAELEASKGATGRIVRIVGPVVDVEFPCLLYTSDAADE